MLVVHWVNIPSALEFPDAMIFLKDAIHSQFFMEAVILICWAIWTSRNAFIFNDLQPNLSVTRAGFVKELQLLKHSVKSRFSHPFDQWLHSVV
jgi:hypothetical protein